MILSLKKKKEKNSLQIFKKKLIIIYVIFENFSETSCCASILNTN